MTPEYESLSEIQRRIRQALSNLPLGSAAPVASTPRQPLEVQLAIPCPSAAGLRSILEKTTLSEAKIDELCVRFLRYGWHMRQVMLTLYNDLCNRVPPSSRDPAFMGFMRNMYTRRYMHCMKQWARRVFDLLRASPHFGGRTASPAVDSLLRGGAGEAAESNEQESRDTCSTITEHGHEAVWSDDEIDAGADDGVHRADYEANVADRDIVERSSIHSKTRTRANSQAGVQNESGYLYARNDDGRACQPGPERSGPRSRSGKNRHGHKPEVVAILESAFSHTPKLTQAEKRKLAEVTGLEPQQVIIWFQNRRNRKTKRRCSGVARTECAPPQPQSTATASDESMMGRASRSPTPSASTNGLGSSSSRSCESLDQSSAREVKRRRLVVAEDDAGHRGTATLESSLPSLSSSTDSATISLSSWSSRQCSREAGHFQRDSLAHSDDEYSYDAAVGKKYQMGSPAFEHLSSPEPTRGSQLSIQQFHDPNAGEMGKMGQMSPDSHTVLGALDGIDLESLSSALPERQVGLAWPPAAVDRDAVSPSMLAAPPEQQRQGRSAAGEPILAHRSLWMADGSQQ